MRYSMLSFLIMILLVWSLGGCDTAKAEIVKGDSWISKSRTLNRPLQIAPVITTQYLSLTIRPGVQRIFYITNLYNPRTRTTYTRGRILQ